MIDGLSAPSPAANRRVMKNRVVQFLLLIAALMAGLDTPAMAYDAAPASIDAHHQAFVEVSDDAAPNDNSPTGSGTELLHHHHCPTGLVTDEPLASGSGLPARDIHLSRASEALASRATAPPTQPPSA